MHYSIEPADLVFVKACKYNEKLKQQIWLETS